MMFDREGWARYAHALRTERKSLRHGLTQWGMFGGITAASAMFQVGMRLDPYLFPGCDKTPIDAPVFIVGIAKSGIDVLHRLLARDESRFVTFRGWEVLLPSLTSRKIAAGVPELAARLLAAGAPAQAEWMRELRRLHPVGLDEPEQDEFLIAWTFGSPALSLLFPYHHWLEDLSDFDRRPAEVQHALMDHYDDCVRRQLYLRGPNKTLLSANPTFTSKLRVLIERYPDARFIHATRDPRLAIGGLLEILEKVWTWLGAEPETREAAADAVVRGCLRDHATAERLLATVDPARVATVDYDDVVADAREAVRGIYRRFGWILPHAFDEELKQLRGPMTASDGAHTAFDRRPHLRAWLERSLRASDPPPKPRLVYSAGRGLS